MPEPILAASSWPTNGDLIADVAQLYIPEHAQVLDPTYGRGKWWTKFRPGFLVTNDIVPGRADFAYDFRKLPEHWASSFDVAAYDPPYIAQGGRATSTAKEFMDRYGLEAAPSTSPLLQEMINEGTREMYRVLRPGGLLLVKCMDYINGGRLWYGTGETFEFARSIGFDIVDRFEHIGHPGQQPPGRTQRHARRNLSTLFVLSKGRIWRRKPLPSHSAILEGVTGIDISGFQPDDVPGPWEFIVTKLSDGTSMPNPRFAAQWAAAARTTRGVYHYARPAKSSGSTQANFFADKALAAGFKPGVDIWQLDAEDGNNAGVGNWREFITEFMPVALARLGRRGFLYAGWPFLQAHGCTDLPYKFMWWLPDYNRNDGTYHPPAAQVPPGLVVIHQFTSIPLDQNRVLNPAAYGAPAPKPPKEKVMPQYRPAFVCAAVLQDTPSSPARAGVQPDGAVFVWDATLGYHGGMNGDPNFAGREAARLINPNAAEAKAGKKYVIIATSGERYALPK